MDDNLTAPLTEDEAQRISAWVRGIAPLTTRYGLTGDYAGKTPEYVALMLRMDGYTSVRDRDVLKAAGRL